MADQKLTQRPIGTSADDNDLIHFVDVSDTTDSPEGTSKQITKGNFASSITPSASEILTAIKTVDGSGSGLDADRLDGQHGSYFYPASNPNGYTNDQSPTEILTAIKTVDGSGSGLDCDLLDGKQGSDYIDISASTQTKAGGFSANFLETNAQGAGATLLAFNTERGWSFEQGGTGAGTFLALRDLSGSKSFAIQSSTRENKFIFNPDLNRFTVQDDTLAGTFGILECNASGGVVTLGNVSGTDTVIRAYGNSDFGNTLTATNFILSSDRTLKDNILAHNVETIDIDLKWFDWKQDKGVGRTQLGVIAQELEVNHPEFVITDEDGLKSVAYIDLLLAKNADLEDRVKRLENKLDKLISSIA